MVCNFFPIDVPSNLPERVFIYSMPIQSQGVSLRVRFHQPLLAVHHWHSVFDLSDRGVDKWDLYRKEIVQMDDVPLGSCGHVYGWYT